MAADLSIPDLLFLDLESSGLYMEKLSMDDPGQPWAQQIAAGLYNSAGVPTNQFSLIVKSDGRGIKEDAAKIHGISSRITGQVGVPESRVLGLLADMLKTCPFDTTMKVITYGDFDTKIMSSLMARFAIAQGKPSDAYDKLWYRRPFVTFINLMTPYCQLYCKIETDFDSGEFKWPTLDEAAEIILGRPKREGHHDAWADMQLTKDIYFALAAQGLFDDNKKEPTVAQ